MVMVGTIIADGAINVRAEGNSTAQVIATLQSGARVRVLEVNADGTWVSVVLPDNRVGWVADFLIEVEEVPQSQAGFPKIPAFFKYQQATPEGSTVLVGTVILDGPLDVLDAPSLDGKLIAQVQLDDQLRVLLIDGEWASIVLPQNRIGYIETFTLDIVERPTSALENLQAPGLALIEPTATPTLTPSNTPTLTLTPRPTNTPSPTSTPSATLTVNPTFELDQTSMAGTNVPTARPTRRPSATPVPPTRTPSPTVTPEATEEATPEATEVLAPQVVTPSDGAVVNAGARYQAQVAGLGMAILLIVGGNLFYLIRGLLRRGRR
jgi:hypothetical protein